MSQAEVLNHLRKHSGRWFTVQELAKIIGIGDKSINENLKRLKKDNLVNTKPSLTRANGRYHTIYYQIMIA